MNTFNMKVTKDILPDELIEEIEREAIMGSEAYIWPDGEHIIIGHNSFCGGVGFEFEELRPMFKIIDMMEDFDEDTAAAKRLITTLENSITRLKELIAEWEDVYED